MSTILGIHTNLTGGSSAEDAKMTGGHAWITVHKNGNVDYYGLWPDQHPDVIDNGPGSDVRRGMEKHDYAADSRYYALSAEQEKVLNRHLNISVKWRYTHNCSSWATEIVRKVTTENVKANEPIIAFVETPRQLGMSIRRLEAKLPSTLAKPVPLKPQLAKPSSSFSSRRAAN